MTPANMRSRRVQYEEFYVHSIGRKFVYLPVNCERKDSNPFTMQIKCSAS